MRGFTVCPLSDKITAKKLSNLFLQQHSSQVQLGHSLGDLLSVHSAGRHPQPAHFMILKQLQNFLALSEPLNDYHIVHVLSPNRFVVGH